MPKARQIAGWLLRRPDALSDDEQSQLAALRARCPHLDTLADHVTSFAQMMTRRTGQDDLENWLAAVETGDLPELRSFAAGIRTNQQAVTNGLTLPWSSGKVEGTVNIKDQDDQAPDVRPRQLQPAPQARRLPPGLTVITEFAAEPN